MKVINSKLAAIGLAAFVFASCSDSNSDAPSNPDITPGDLTSVILQSQNVDNSRVSNYKNGTANARKFFLYSRAGATNFVTSMPTVPTEPSEPKYLNGASDLTNKDYAISSNQTINFAGKNITGATIFVHGGSTFEYDQTTKMTDTKIVLLGSGTLKYTGNGEMVSKGNEVFCTNVKNYVIATGDININGGFYAQFRDNDTDAKTGLGAIKETTKDEKEKSITPTQNVTFGPNAQVFINGSIRAKKLNVEEGANVYTKANVFNNEEGSVNGNLQVDGFIQAVKLNVSGNLIANAAVKVTDTFNVNDGANIQASYINVTDNTKTGDNKIIKGDATLNLKGNCQININNKNVITANNLVTDNASAGQIKLNGDNAVAVIKAYKFTNNGAEKINTFATPGDNSTFMFEFTESYNGSTKYSTFEDLDIACTYVDYDKTNQNKNMVQLVDEKNKKYGYEWKGDAAQITKQIKLDLVAAAEPTTDGESATCIEPANGKLYVAYHTYGNNEVGGNLEVASMSGKTLTIEQSLKSEKIDYNHLLVDNGYVYLAGSEQGNKSNGVTGVGAFLGRVKLDGSSLSNKLEQYAINKKVSGIDANCVAKFNDEYVVATTQGFTVFDNSFGHWTKTGTEGKYVVNANNKVYALDLNNVSVYDNTNLENATTYNIGEVTPKDNKAVLAVDGDVIYVCKGENGVSKIDASGNVSQFYTCPTFVPSVESGKEQVETVKGHANGIAVDSKYVYVACGGYGLVVLDKATGKEVCHRKAFNGKSANFVAVDGKNIYVAYGKSRIQVFTLTATN